MSVRRILNIIPCLIILLLCGCGEDTVYFPSYSEEFLQYKQSCPPTLKQFCEEWNASGRNQGWSYWYKSENDVNEILKWKRANCVGMVVFLKTIYGFDSLIFTQRDNSSHMILYGKAPAGKYFCVSWPGIWSTAKSGIPLDYLESNCTEYNDFYEFLKTKFAIK